LFLNIMQNCFIN